MTDNDTLIKSFYYSNGGFFSGAKRIQTEFEDNHVRLYYIERFKDEVSYYINLNEWKAFSNTVITDFCVFEWNERYVNENILDGTQWVVSIELLNGNTKKIYGSNQFPEGWNEFNCYLTKFIEKKRLGNDNFNIDIDI